MKHLFKRLYKRLTAAIFLILAAPLVLLMRLARPVVQVRLGALDIGRLGGSFNAFWYIALENSISPPTHTFDIFFWLPTNTISNHFWLKILSRHIRLIPPYPFVSHLFLSANRLNKYFPNSSSNVISFPHAFSPSNISTRLCLANPNPQLKFTKNEEELGKHNLTELGIPEGQPFICFHARDSSYLDAKHPNVDWKYHDYRDSTIGNYLPAAEEMARSGLWAVRIGEVAKEPIIATHSAIIDYTFSGKRSDFMDIYLGANCKFMICSETGLNLVPTMFRRPILFVNLVLLPYIYVWCTGVVITKKFFSLSRNRLLTYREIFSPDTGVYGETGMAAINDIELIENTAAEIRAASIEMNDRINGKWKATNEDLRLQTQFWELFGKERARNPDIQIGAEFLRQNADLLD